METLKSKPHLLQTQNLFKALRHKDSWCALQHGGVRAVWCERELKVNLMCHSEEKTRSVTEFLTDISSSRRFSEYPIL